MAGTKAASANVRGQLHWLSAGQYFWYVWPGKGPRSAQRYGERIGARSFVVERGAAASQFCHPLRRSTARQH